MPVYDVIIVGAGIEGSAAAYYLSKEYPKVMLLEQVTKIMQSIMCCAFNFSFSFGKCVG